MKNILLSMIFVGVLVISSCTDFLKEDPRNTLPAETFFSSRQMVEGAVNNLYRLGPNNWANPGVYNGSNLMMGGWAAGLFDNLNYKGQELYIQYVQKFEINGSNSDTKMGDIFNQPYQAIARANGVINFVPNMDLVASSMTEAQRNTFVAEAKFFRAQNYLWLVKHFGDVPMVLVPQNATDDLKLPRDDAKKIYEQVIIPDLLEAIKILPVSTQYGRGMRITAPVASAYLIDAYVQMTGFPIKDASKWALAAAEAKKFLPGGAYASLYSLLQNEDFAELSAYNKLRSVNVHTASPGGRKTTNCPEFIYITEYHPGISNAGFNANAYPMQVGALGSSECKVTLTNNAYKPMPRLLSMYDTITVRDLRLKERQFFTNYFDRANGSRLYNPPDNTPSPYFFYDWGGVKVENTSGRHFAIYRLAEMYLFAAEAIAQAEGVTDQAIDALATIRARAYEWGYTNEEIESKKPKADVVAALTGLSKEKFIEEVWLEIYRELVFEFKQWNLIQRTRLYPKTNPMDASIPVGTAQFVDITTVGTDFSAGKKFTLNNLLWPFPLTQVQRNPNLTQNPGYEF